MRGHIISLNSKYRSLLAGKILRISAELEDSHFLPAFRRQIRRAPAMGVSRPGRENPRPASLMRLILFGKTGSARGMQNSPA
jgi:hypothetical protein